VATYTPLPVIFGIGFMQGRWQRPVKSRAAVIATNDDGRKGRPYFEDTGAEEWGLWVQLTPGQQMAGDHLPQGK
jgi:hypothetical protein